MGQQLWVTNSLGGNLTNNKLSKQLRYQALPDYVYRQMAMIKDEGLGAKTGDTIIFDKILRIDTKGGSLSETSTVPSNLIKVVKDSTVVVEWGKKLFCSLCRFFTLAFRTVVVRFSVAGFTECFAV